MRKFEEGKRYTDGAMTFEIIKRTAKTVTFAYILHAGKTNEKRAAKSSSFFVLLIKSNRQEI